MSNTILIDDHTINKSAWGQLYGSSLSLAFAEYCQQTPGIKLCITPDNWYAKQLIDELQFYFKDHHQPQEILVFPDWETLPYDQFSPHQDIISERLTTLSRLPQLKTAIVISSVSTLMHKLCPPDFVQQHSLLLQCQQNLNIETFRQQLIQAGYYSVNTVLEHGEFALRGAILDLFPMGSSVPFRVELFDDEILSLRSFNPESQRTIEKIDKIHILPAREVRYRSMKQSLLDKFPRVLSVIYPYFSPKQSVFLIIYPPNRLSVWWEPHWTMLSSFGKR